MSSQIISWLNNAYAMEKSIEQALKSHAEDAKDNPVLYEAIIAHIKETQEQAEMVKSRIEELGGEVSALSSGIASARGMMLAMPSKVFEEHVLMNTIVEYATEHFEMASYRAIMIAARATGDIETADMCQKILEQEQRTAEWIHDNLPSLVNEQIKVENVTLG